ncbi:MULTISPECIES: oxepin-CoA hydrolase, alternative type [unclassified Haematospirillum]|uniref:oxepin-CoA hydrolase, alternative type n=1 Tax=unclassified Haematospirillum TaxID=2622088 RepID=UPI001438A8F0|nr:MULTISPECIES: enoyl-CoA hydratase family protein [unclassified Haematospirillum]NKD55865.1 enoyl-CoA hydratase [Haematospirillum sp. H4890]NKD75928.1 enoyl-CoA hydratase [Haematospirillum sp. H4485]
MTITSTKIPNLDVPVDIRREHSALVITMHDPATRNAVGEVLFQKGREALEEVRHDTSIRSVILAGAGGTFCSGGNLSMLTTLRQQPQERTQAAFESFHGFIKAIRSAPVPVIAAVEGDAAGAGFSMALACDFIIASETARFTMAYVQVGLTPDGGGSWFLTRSLPHALASRLVILGEPIWARELDRYGLIRQMVPEGEVTEAARTFAMLIALGPRCAMERGKKLLQAAANNVLNTQMDLEAQNFGEALHHPESIEGMRAFMEKRPPRYT